jgi:hypothetical protein
VNPKLQALLTLQERDDEINGIEARLAALAPRFAELDAEQATADRQLASTRATIEREEQRQRELIGRAEDFRRLNARAVSHMELVRKVHEANAAAAQVEISRRALADVESELAAVSQRLASLREAAAAAELNKVEVEERLAGTRAELDAQRGALDEALTGARGRREQAAASVEPRTLQRYDRVRARRRQRSVFALRGMSCSNCDTTVPTQRRAALASGDAVEICESCGVLLYSAG